jgi:hypothetical protein
MGRNGSQERVSWHVICTFDFNSTWVLILYVLPEEIQYLNNFSNKFISNTVNKIYFLNLFILQRGGPVWLVNCLRFVIFIWNTSIWLIDCFVWWMNVKFLVKIIYHLRSVFDQNFKLAWTQNSVWILNQMSNTVKDKPLIICKSCCKVHNF